MCFFGVSLIDQKFIINHDCQILNYWNVDRIDFAPLKLDKIYLNGNKNLSFCLFLQHKSPRKRKLQFLRIPITFSHEIQYRQLCNFIPFNIEFFLIHKCIQRTAVLS